VIYMDISMPHMSGYECAIKIREIVGDAVWICALTGNSFAEDRVRAQESGMNFFLSKPARQDDIKNSLARFIQDNSIV